MAARLSESELNYSCPICRDIFRDPVLLTCCHSFCKDCLQNWWAEKLIRECPVCKRRSSKSDPPRNLALKNLCEAFVQDLSLASARCEAMCSLHSEKLKLFCLDHKQPVCVVCRDSKTHVKHRFRPIDEAAQDYKAELRKSLKPLQEKVEHLHQVKFNFELTQSHIVGQALDTEMQIREEFKRLKCFLEKEEGARITALKEEEGQKIRVMGQKIQALSREIKALTDTIRATEKELNSECIPFLQNYKAAVQRVQQRPLLADPSLGPGALIDVAKHLGNLTYNIWNKLKETVTYSPVILDPNTACPYLDVSDDLKSVTYRDSERALPQNPERFTCYPTVLGSEGFNSGTHSWNIEVTNDADWAVGVVAESIVRKGEILTGDWEIWFKNGEYRAYSPPHTDKVLPVKNQIRRIRVRLDWNRGKLSFSDPDTITDIYTFSQTFSERLFPFINTLDTKPPRIIPVKVTTKLEV
ncbi:zinc-binding protein A33-like [Acanthopagrus latus]|uniref:zinc-binding protein A33-like n=1 Tax=Acanthopagrus latus TaxID=8177 RepID=UPI00187BDA8F|nr:zinc-binding protein A33-like [Acanthopagrus latus]